VFIYIGARSLFCAFSSGNTGVFEKPAVDRVGGFWAFSSGNTPVQVEAKANPRSIYSYYGWLGLPSGELRANAVETDRDTTLARG
jgi:hypothetical protein